MLNKQTASMIISFLVNKYETSGAHFAFPIDNSNHSSLALGSGGKEKTRSVVFREILLLDI